MNHDAKERADDGVNREAPSVWAMVLGYNHPEVTIDCVQSLLRSRCKGMVILYVDNGSDIDNAREVLAACPGIRSIRIPVNEGAANGFNVGLSYALEQGADYVAMINNDTTFEPDAMQKLVDTARARPDAGVVVPKIYVHDHPRILWSAGSRMRTFPPAMVMYKSKGDESPDATYPASPDVATYCIALFPREALRAVGLMDVSYNFFYDDYDHSLRLREAGYEIALAHGARTYHKVSVTGGAGSNKPAFWRCYGNSASVFARKHARRRPWMTGFPHRWFVILRFLLEGHFYGLRPFLAGVREGRTKELTPVPGWDYCRGQYHPFTGSD